MRACACVVCDKKKPYSIRFTAPKVIIVQSLASTELFRQGCGCNRYFTTYPLVGVGALFTFVVRKNCGTMIYALYI